MPDDPKTRVQIDGEWHSIAESGLRVEQLSPSHFIVWDGNAACEVFETDGTFSDGQSLDGVEVHLESERERIVRERFGDLGGGAKGAAIGTHIVMAPMPGMIRAVAVAAGDVVERQTMLVVLEAMKMENNILAGVSGRVTRVHAIVGTSVDKNAALVEIELS